MKNRFARRTDKSQVGVVNVLRVQGAQVVVTNSGNDFPDLLVCKSAWKLVEVKELDGHFSRGQLMFLTVAHGPVDIVVGENDAIVSYREDRYLAPYQQRLIGAWLATNPNQETIRVKKLLKIIGRISNEKQREKPGTNGNERSTDTSLIRR